MAHDGQDMTLSTPADTVLPDLLVLTAAALTYLAASLASLLNIARWWALLRR